MKTQTEPQYKTLVAGDIRQEGDEWRTKPEWFSTAPCARTHQKNFGPVSFLIGLPIIPSDLIHLEFRRPV